MQALPATFAMARAERLNAWHNAHLCAMNVDVEKLACEGRAEQHRRVCVTEGICLCKDRARTWFLNSWRDMLTRMLNKARGSLAKLYCPNELRVAADAGMLVVNVADELGESCNFFHLSSLRYKPIRPVLLRLLEVGSLPV